MIQDQGAAYWNKRVKKYGHTGWWDKRIYAYDQQVRIRLIEYILEKYRPRFHCALDFGCGTGDLTRTMAQHADFVKGFDISGEVLTKARALTEQKNVQYVSDQNEVLNDSSVYDVVLSITVLQHILNEDDFLTALNRISRCISLDGIFIALESLTDNAPQKSDYSITRNKDEYTAAIEQAGFQILELKRFYSPLSNDVPQCQAYFRSIISKILNRVGSLRSLQHYAEKYLISPEGYLFEVDPDKKLDCQSYLIIAKHL